VGSTAYANGGKCESEPIRSQQLWSECSRLLANCIIYYNACIQSDLLERAERRQDTKGRRDQASEPGKLEACEPLGDPDSIAHTLWSVAQIELRQQHFEQAFEHLAASYDINLKLGRLDAICSVGQDFGQLLCVAGDREKGLAVLERSRDGFVKLGRPENSSYVQSIINEISERAKKYAR
jgi:Tn3 transposase DDE domain